MLLFLFVLIVLTLLTATPFLSSLTAVLPKELKFRPILTEQPVDGGLSVFLTFRCAIMEKSTVGTQQNVKTEERHSIFFYHFPSSLALGFQSQGAAVET